MKGVLHNGMSLFQDLKLKRRKVDSRCSSDGESIGTSDSTASLSPDAQTQGEGSPKNKERCTTPDELVRTPTIPLPPISSSASSMSNNNAASKGSFMFMPNNNELRKDGGGAGAASILNGKVNFNKITNGVIKLTNDINKQNGNSSSESNTIHENGFSTKKSRASSLEKMQQEEEKAAAAARSKSPSAPTPQLPPPPPSSSSSSPLSNGNSTPPATMSPPAPKEMQKSPQSDKQTNKTEENEKNEQSEVDEQGKKSPATIKKEDEDTNSQYQNSVIAEKRKFSLTLSSSPNSPSTSPLGNRNPREIINRSSPPGKINRSPPPIASFLLGKRSSGDSSPPSSKSSSRVPSPQEILHLQQLHRQSSASSSPIHHHQQQQAQLLLSQQSHLHSRLLNGPSAGNSHYPDTRMMMNSPSSFVHAELRTLAEKPDPLSVVTSTSLSFHHHSMYRINGVRPEVISGGAVTPTNPPSTAPGNGAPNSSNGSPQINGSNSSNSSGSIRKSPSSILSNRSPNSSPRSNSNSSGGSLSNVHNVHSPPNNTNNNMMMASLSSSASGQNGGHNHVNLNRTPTVIMGEAGGVRTMLWSQPGGQTISSDVPPSLQSGSMNNSHYGPSSPSQHHLTNGHSNSTSSSPPSLHHQSNSVSAHLKGGLSMERLWASEALNLSTGGNSNGFGGSNRNSNNGTDTFSTRNNNSHHHQQQNGTMPIPVLSNGMHHLQNGNTSLHPDDEDYEQPMICMICEDRATGLHYGIITCEGCKGFFKRTVQNRRVYTCVADGTCEITKAQRNRCQYCRFKKCIEQGMVLQAVREDRMPGGRNSGAVYNLYKVPVKYRKHKKGNRGGMNGKPEKNNNNGNSMLGSNNNSNSSSNGLIPNLGSSPSPQNITGTILKAALTSPSEINHLRPSTAIPFEQAAAMITNLVQCDNFHDIAALQNWEELLEGRGDLSEKLCQMGDSIVYRLVQWTKRLPFYQEVPVDVHTRILTHKWHELLVLTTSAWQAMNTPGPSTNMTIEEEAMENLHVLQRCLQAMMGRSLTLEQLRQDVGQMVERLTYLTRSFRRLGIRLEEYVTLKVIAMLQSTGAKSNEVGVIQERYIKCLGTFLEVTCPSHTNRLSDLLRTLPEVQAAAALLLESKMFYVPFLLNSALQR